MRKTVAVILLTLAGIASLSAADLPICYQHPATNDQPMIEAAKPSPQGSTGRL